MSRPRGRGPDDVLNRLANLERDLELGPGEAFGRIFELKVSAPRGVCERSDLLGRIDRDFLDTLRVGAEHHFALQGGRRIVEVDDDLLRALDRLEGALDQFRAALGQDLDRDIVRNGAALDDRADEVEISLRGGGKGDLDLLEPHANQKLEHAVLALDAHRLDQRLIAVAEIDRAPDRGLVDDPGGPLAIGQDDGRVGAVLLNRHLCHDGPWEDLRRPGSQSAGRTCLSFSIRRMRNCCPGASARRAAKDEGRRPRSHGRPSSREQRKNQPAQSVAMDKRVPRIHKRPAIGEIKCDHWSAIGRAPSR